MDIVVWQEQGRVPVTVLHVRGELNVNSYEQLQAEARKAFDAGARDMILDLTEVPYVSSAGLRGIHAIFAMLRTAATDETDEAVSKGLRDGTYKSPHLKLLSPSDHVMEVLHTSGFDMYLEVYTDLPQAVASF